MTWQTRLQNEIQMQYKSNLNTYTYGISYKKFVLKTWRDWFQILAYQGSLGFIPVKENYGIIKEEREQTTRLNQVAILHPIFDKTMKTIDVL